MSSRAPWRAAILILVLAACRTSDPEQREGGVALTKPKPVRSEPFIQVVTAPATEVQGFDLAGASSCLPLAEGRACIARQDDVADACVKAQGSAKRCEDCRTVCDKPVKR